MAPATAAEMVIKNATLGHVRMMAAKKIVEYREKGGQMAQRCDAGGGHGVSAAAAAVAGADRAKSRGRRRQACLETSTGQSV